MKHNVYGLGNPDERQASPLLRSTAAELTSQIYEVHLDLIVYALRTKSIVLFVLIPNMDIHTVLQWYIQTHRLLNYLKEVNKKATVHENLRTLKKVHNSSLYSAISKSVWSDSGTRR